MFHFIFFSSHDKLTKKKKKIKRSINNVITQKRNIESHSEFHKPGLSYLFTILSIIDYCFHKLVNIIFNQLNDFCFYVKIILLFKVAFLRLLKLR